jgi:hypothetical protein
LREVKAFTVTMFESLFLISGPKAQSNNPSKCTAKEYFCEEEERQIKEFPKVNAALLTVFLQNRGNLDISSLIFVRGVQTERL